MLDFIPSDWISITAETYCSSVRDGTHDSPKFHEEGHPLVTSKYIKGGILDLQTAGLISNSDYEEINRRSKVDQWDVLYSMIGTVGEIYLIEEAEPSYAIKNVGLFKTKSEEDGRWLAYWLQTPQARQLIYERLRGASQQYIPLGELRKLLIPLPSDNDTRRKIITVMSSYDDLIAANQRRIQLLEESARLLYRKWFVKLRFPGHETVPVTDGVPEGWVHGTAHDFVEVLSGGTPKTGYEHYWDGGIPFFTPKDCPDTYYVTETEKTLTESGVESCNSRLFPKDTIFVTARGTVGKIALAQRPMAMNQSCYALVPKQDYDNLFLFLAMRDAVEHFKQVASGGVFSAIVVDTFKVIPFVKPTQTLTESFGMLVRPVFDQVETIIRQNSALKQARDVLLPRLMSGVLDVSRISVPKEIEV